MLQRLFPLNNVSVSAPAKKMILCILCGLIALVVKFHFDASTS